MLVLSQAIFFGLAAYHTDDQLYYPEGNINAIPVRGYSWIWYHPEHWMISLVLVSLGIVLFTFGTIKDIQRAEKQK